jgi:hypothetical protein
MIDPPLKMFTDRAYLPEGVEHCLMLIPFWGDYHSHDGYARLEKHGKELLELVAPEDANMALLPFDGNQLLHHERHPNPRALELANRFVERATTAGLKTIVIVNSDSTEPIELPNVIVFRTSLNRATRAPHEFALPAWHEDLVTNHFDGRPTTKARPDVPSVGFCGLAAASGPPLKRRIKMLLRQLGRPIGYRIEHNDGIYLRRAAMEALSRCAAVRTEFIVRSQYFGGGLGDAELKSRVRREYIENLAGNDYALCARGYGNFSFRFFEAMSLGRIPLLIDTECVLPYDFIHDYRDYCVIVPESRLRDIGQFVNEFHSGLSPAGYADLQLGIREFWVRYLSPEGFFRNLSLHWDASRRASRLGPRYGEPPVWKSAIGSLPPQSAA